MLGASHGTLSTDPLLYLGTLGGVALTWGTLYIRVIYPRAQAHKQHEAERSDLRRKLADRDELRSGFLDGVPEVPGMTPAVKPAAVRVAELEEWRAVHDVPSADGR